MDYEILDQLKDQSEPRREAYQEKNQVYVQSGIEEAIEPFNGSAGNIKLYIYKNYFMTSGAIDLAIVIREDKQGKRGEFMFSQVECAIFPLYMGKTDAFDIPATIEPPEIHPDQAKFILEKRSLPKKRYNEGEFDPEKNKWNVNLIAENLGMSNRIVAQYCRALGI